MAHRARAHRPSADQIRLKSAFFTDDEVNPVKGADLDRLVEELYAMPPEIIAEVRSIIAAGAK